METYVRMQEAFPGTALPANVVVNAPDVNAPAVQAAIQELEACARERPDASRSPSRSTTTRRSRTSRCRWRATARTRPRAALATLRDDIVPATVGTLPETETGVTGLTARWADSTDAIKSKLPLVFAFVLLLAFVVMLVAFRSLVIAAKAIVLNLLSVAAAWRARARLPARHRQGLPRLQLDRRDLP